MTRYGSIQLAHVKRLARILKLACSNFNYLTCQRENNKGAGQTERMHRLICTIVVCMQKLEKVSMGHGCPRLLFLFHLQLNIGYTISEQDTIYILQTEFIATLFL